MRIAVVGGGPGGLFLATLVKPADPTVEVTVFERNRADDTFGFGVVFSDATLAAIDAADPVLRDALARSTAALGRDRGPAQGRAVPLRRQRDGRHRPHDPARRCCSSAAAERRRDAAFRAPRSDPDDLAGVTTWSSPPTAPTHGSGSGSARAVSSRSVETAAAKFIWFGTDVPVRRADLRARARCRRRVRRARLPDRPGRQHVHRRDRRGLVAAGRAGRVRRHPAARGRAT